nr:MAG TPA: hypothetical protein [Caudoviricetes sp.]
MINEEVLWADFEHAINDGYYQPVIIPKDEVALLPLSIRMNTFLSLMENRLNTTVDILRELDALKEVVVILREPRNRNVTIRFDYGNYINGILIFADRTITSYTAWHENKITEGQEIRLDRATLTTCDFCLQRLFDIHLTRMREEAEAVQKFIGERRKIHHSRTIPTEAV